METLLERASRVLSDHPAPALPLDELRRLVRGSGVAVHDEALERALLSGPDRLRLLDPWRGPWEPVRRAAWLARRLRGPGGAGRRGQGPHPLPDVGRRWVVGRPQRVRPGRRADGAVGRMRVTLAHLGWTVDERSHRDVSRWCRLVWEGERVRDRVRNARSG